MSLGVNLAVVAINPDVALKLLELTETSDIKPFFTEVQSFLLLENSLYKSGQ
jgi:hypothetical protein